MCGFYICCVGFACLDVVCDELVPGMCVCSSFLISVCMFIVSKALLISSGTRGSGVLSSAGDVLEMSVVRGVGGVCDMCMSLAWSGVGGVGCERIGFGLYQFWRNRWNMCVFWLR